MSPQRYPFPLDSVGLVHRRDTTPEGSVNGCGSGMVQMSGKADAASWGSSCEQAFVKVDVALKLNL